jgi:hypothetical protein
MVYICTGYMGQQKFDNTIIVKLTDAQRHHLDYVAGSTATMSEVIRMALAPLTPEIVREMKIADLKRQAEAIERANIGLPPELQQPLPGPFRVKRRYRKTGKYSKKAKQERASVSTTGSRSDGVEVVPSFSDSKK